MCVYIDLGDHTPTHKHTRTLVFFARHFSHAFHTRLCLSCWWGCAIVRGDVRDLSGADKRPDPDADFPGFAFLLGWSFRSAAGATCEVVITVWSDSLCVVRWLATSSVCIFL